jgi:hypothetical protein
VRVDPTGVVLSTAGLSGECFLTLTWREVLDPSQPPNAPVLLHAPWLRLLGIADFQDTGDQVILARVTLDTTGLVTGLSVEGRRLVGLPASRLELRRPRAASAPTLSVDHLPAAELRARADGGLELNLLPPSGPPRPALTVEGLTGHLALISQGGNVGIGTTSPGAPLEIRGSGDPLFLINHTGAAGHPALWLQQDGAPKAFLWWDQANNRLNLGTPTTNPIVSLQNNGNVGIGTATPQGKLEVSGDIRAGNSDLYFTKTDHNHTGIGNTPGFAAIENAANYDALMILGRAGTARGRYVRLWDYLQINGGMEVTGSSNIGGNLAVGGTLTAGGNVTYNGAVNISGGLDVRSTGTAVSGHGGSGFFVSGVYGDGNLAMLANGTNTGIWAAGNSYGVVAASTGTAGQFFGSVNITGTLSKGGGGFKIDHPLDPANKYLSHSFVESPEMLNIYNGNTTTDERGEATVVLPDYFETLNRDFRYQLTPIGQIAQAAVIGEIRDNRFTIQTDKPGVTVSWQVTGVRQDPWANTHRITVEEAKPEAERSFYLHPEVHRQPETRSILAAQHGEEMLEQIRK